jgi:hypothetical protein
MSTCRKYRAEPLWIPIEFAIEFALRGYYRSSLGQKVFKFKYFRFFFTNTPQNWPKTWVLWPKNGQKRYCKLFADTLNYWGCNAGKWCRKPHIEWLKIGMLKYFWYFCIIFKFKYFKANTRQIRQKTSFFKYDSLVPINRGTAKLVRSFEIGHSCLHAMP